MKLFLHVGWPKTGTSALQVFLYNNRNVLQSLNFHYPEPHNLIPPTPGNGWHIFPESKSIESINSFLNGLETGQHENVLLSCEGLIRTESLDSMHALISEKFSEITIAIYVRDQVSHTISYINELISVGQTIGYDDLNLLPNFTKNTLKYMDSFGQSNVSIRAYKPTSNDWVCLDFLKFLGLSDSADYFKFDNAKPTHPSLPFDLLQAKHAINSLGYSKAQTRKFYSRDFFNRFLHAKHESLNINKELVENIYQSNEKYNVRLQQLTGLNLNQENIDYDITQHENYISELDIQFILKFFASSTIEQSTNFDKRVTELEEHMVKLYQDNIDKLQRAHEIQLAEVKNQLTELLEVVNLNSDTQHHVYNNRWLSKFTARTKNIFRLFSKKK